MTPMRHPADGRLHFSEVKLHALSPAHVKLACEHARDMSRPMTVGAVADCIVFGNRGYACYQGKVRNGAAWESWRDANAGMIHCIQSELDDAEGAAHAVLADPVAAPLLDGCEFQRVMHWDAYGLPCGAGVAGERGGFDAVHHEKGYIADLKVTSCTEPDDLMRHARRMFWPEQGAWYLDGANSLGMAIDVFHLIAVESAPPHNVTVLTLTPKRLAVARRNLTRWTERHRACEEAGAWPGYVQAPVDFDVSEWDEE